MAQGIYLSCRSDCLPGSFQFLNQSQLTECLLCCGADVRCSVRHYAVNCISREFLSEFCRCCSQPRTHHPSDAMGSTIIRVGTRCFQLHVPLQNDSIIRQINSCSILRRGQPKIYSILVLQHLHRFSIWLQPERLYELNAYTMLVLRPL